MVVMLNAVYPGLILASNWLDFEIGPISVSWMRAPLEKSELAMPVVLMMRTKKHSHYGVVHYHQTTIITTFIIINTITIIVTTTTIIFVAGTIIFITILNC